MLEQLLSRAVNLFISDGIRAFEKDRAANCLRESMAERINREIRFNYELLGVRKKKVLTDSTKIKTIIDSTTTSAFDAINDTGIPMTLISDKKITENDWQSMHNKYKVHNKSYSRWTKNITSTSMLLERIYHRLKIVKILNSLDIVKNEASIAYLSYLMRAYLIQVTNIDPITELMGMGHF